MRKQRIPPFVFPVFILLVILCLALLRLALRLSPRLKAKTSRLARLDQVETSLPERLSPHLKSRVAGLARSIQLETSLAAACQGLWLLRRNEPFCALDLDTPDATVRITLW